MTLDFIEYDVQGITVLRLTGRLILGEATAKFRKLIRDTLEQNKKQIVLNMSEVYFVDSSGLGELVSAYTAVTNQGGRLKLLKLTQRVQDLVQLTKVYRILEVYDDEQKAFESFSQT